MKHKLIHTENYLLVVDDSDIEDYDYTKFDVQDFSTCLWRLKAHLPLNNSPILEGVDLLPPLEDDLHELAVKFSIDESYGENGRGYLYNGFVFGYNKAKKTYKYTEEDIIAAYIDGGNNGALYRALEEAEDWDAVKEMDENHDNRIKELIQSLQQPKLPIAFECEMEILGIQTIKDGDLTVNYLPMPGMDYTPKPKTTNNSQGQTVWVGTYEY